MNFKTDDILKQRGDRYGDYARNAACTQSLVDILQQCMGYAKWDAAPPFLKEGIHMVCHKLARCACGDPNYDDNWTDIAGYATLVRDILSHQHCESVIRREDEACQ